MLLSNKQIFECSHSLRHWGYRNDKRGFCLQETPSLLGEQISRHLPAVGGASNPVFMCQEGFLEEMTSKLKNKD